MFTISQTIFGLGFFLVVMVLPDFNDVVLGKTERFVTYLFIPFILTCLPASLLLPGMVKKGNKKTIYSVSLDCGRIFWRVTVSVSMSRYA